LKIRYLLDEDDQYNGYDIPDDEKSQKDLLRALMNVRPPKEIDDEFLSIQDEGLFPENYQPEEEAVRIYANAKQRTIATARFFTAGLLPAADEDVEYHADFDTMDPVFNPQLTFVTDAYAKAAEAQIREMYT